MDIFICVQETIGKDVPFLRTPKRDQGIAIVVPFAQLAPSGRFLHRCECHAFRSGIGESNLEMDPRGSCFVEEDIVVEPSSLQGMVKCACFINHHLETELLGPLLDLAPLF